MPRRRKPSRSERRPAGRPTMPRWLARQVDPDQLSASLRFLAFAADPLDSWLVPFPLRKFPLTLPSASEAVGDGVELETSRLETALEGINAVVSYSIRCSIGTQEFGERSAGCQWGATPCPH